MSPQARFSIETVPHSFTKTPSHTFAAECFATAIRSTASSTWSRTAALCTHLCSPHDTHRHTSTHTMNTHTNFSVSVFPPSQSLSLSQHTHTSRYSSISCSHLMAYICSQLLKYLQCHTQTHIHHSLWNPATNEHDLFWWAAHMKLWRRSSIWSHMSKCVCQHSLRMSWWG